MIDEYCYDCKYFNRSVPHIVICDYIGHKGKARGCPAGRGCTKKEPRTGPKRRPKTVIIPKEDNHD